MFDGRNRHNGARVSDLVEGTCENKYTTARVASLEKAWPSEEAQEEEGYPGLKKSALKRGRTLSVMSTSCADGREGDGTRACLRVLAGQTWRSKYRRSLVCA